VGGRVTVDRYAEATLPTAFGEFRIVVYRPTDAAVHEDPLRQEEHVALCKGEVSGAQDVFVRVHSECLTGEALGSLRCDCREQLDSALAQIAALGTGVVVYLRQEGRGIGLGNKVRAYSLQENQGQDTVEANEALGFDADLRSFELAAAILEELGVESVRLNTNNRRKIDGLVKAGIRVSERIPSKATVQTYNQHYLRTKRDRLGHLFSHVLGELDSPS